VSNYERDNWDYQSELEDNAVTDTNVGVEDTPNYKNSVADDFDDALFEEPKPWRPSPEEEAQKEAKILAALKEQERIRDENLFIAEDKREFVKPLTPEQFKSLGHHSRWKLRQQTKQWVSQVAASQPTEAELLAAALGNIPCPACADTRELKGINYGKDTGYYEPNQHISCWCRYPRAIQAEVDLLVGKRYRGYDFRTIQPSGELKQPKLQQKQEWQEIFQTLEQDKQAKRTNPEKYQPHNFLFAGSAGTGKSTTASMIAREALRLDWDKPTGIEYAANPARWVWVVDCQELFDQYTAWATSRFSEKPAPEPAVTVAKVEKAAARGCTPTLILEELDKGKLTESRFTFLFQLVNAFDRNGGQLVITTNRTMDRFPALFAENESETVRTSGEPMIRRFLQNNCITKQWF